MDNISNHWANFWWAILCFWHKTCPPSEWLESSMLEYVSRWFGNHSWHQVAGCCGDKISSRVTLRLMWLNKQLTFCFQWMKGKNQFLGYLE